MQPLIFLQLVSLMTIVDIVRGAIQREIYRDRKQKNPGGIVIQEFLAG